MEIRLNVKLTTKDMFDFMMKHTYSTISGYVGLVLSICALLGFFASLTNSQFTMAYRVVLIFTGLLFTVIQPLNLYWKSKRQVEKNEAINKTMEFVIDGSKIKVRHGDDSVEYDWNQVYKVNSSKNSIFMYTSRYHSFIMPRDAFGEGDISKLRELIITKATSAKSVKIGKVD